MLADLQRLWSASDDATPWAWHDAADSATVQSLQADRLRSPSSRPVWRLQWEGASQLQTSVCMQVLSHNNVSLSAQFHDRHLIWQEACTQRLAHKR